MGLNKQKGSFAPLPMRGDRHAEMQGKKLFVVAAISIVVLVVLVLLLFSYDSDSSIAGEAFRAVTDGTTSCSDGQICLYAETSAVSSVINDATLNPGDQFELIVGYVPDASYTDVSFGEVTISYDPNRISIDTSVGVTWDLDSSIWDIQFEHDGGSSSGASSGLNDFSLVFAASGAGETVVSGTFVPIATIPFIAGAVADFGVDAFVDGSTEEINIVLSNAFLEYYDSSSASLVDIFSSSFSVQDLYFDVNVNPLFQSIDGEMFPTDGSNLDLGMVDVSEGSVSFDLEAFDYGAPDSANPEITNGDLDIIIELNGPSGFVEEIDSRSYTSSTYLGFDSSLIEFRETGSLSYSVQWPIEVDVDSLSVGDYELIFTLYNDDGGEVGKTVEFEVISSGLPEIVTVAGQSIDIATTLDLGNFDRGNSLSLGIWVEDSDYDSSVSLGNEDLELYFESSGETFISDILDTSIGTLESPYFRLVEEPIAGAYSLDFKQDSSGNLLLADGNYGLFVTLSGSSATGVGPYEVTFSIVDGELQVADVNDLNGYVGVTLGETIGILYDLDGVVSPTWAVQEIGFSPEVSGTVSTFIDSDSTSMTHVEGNGDSVSGLYLYFSSWTPTLVDVGVHQFQLDASTLDGDSISETFYVTISEDLDCSSDSGDAYYSLSPDGSFLVSNGVRGRGASITVEAGEEVEFSALVVDDESHLGTIQLEDRLGSSSFGSAREYTPSDREAYSWSDTWTPTASDIGSHTFGLNVGELCGNGFRAGLDTTVTVTVVAEDSLPGLNDPDVFIDSYESTISAGELQDLYVFYQDSADEDAPVTIDVDVISATAGVVETLSYSIDALTAFEVDPTTSEWEIYVPFIQDTSGTYTVQITVTDESGNMGSDSVEIVVEEVAVDSISSGEGSSGTEGMTTESYDLELLLEVTGPSGEEISDLSDLVVGDEYVFDVVITALEDMDDYIVFLQIEDYRSGEVYFVDYVEEGSLAVGESQTSDFEFDVEEELSYIAKVFVWSNRASEGGERLLPMQVME